MKRKDGELAGQLHWNLSGVSHIGVRPNFQRQGIATAMYRWAKELDPDLKHGFVVARVLGRGLTLSILKNESRSVALKPN